MRCINPRFIYLLTYLLIYLLHGVFEDLIVGGVELNQVVWERKAPVGSRGGTQVGVWGRSPSPPEAEI